MAGTGAVSNQTKPARVSQLSWGRSWGCRPMYILGCLSEVSIRQSVWSSPRSVPVCMPLGMRDWPRPRPYLGVSCLRPRNGESVTLWVAKHVRGQGRGELTDLPKRR